MNIKAASPSLLVRPETSAGVIPAADLAEIEANAGFSVERTQELERVTNHAANTPSTMAASDKTASNTLDCAYVASVSPTVLFEFSVW